ncbi:MAG TPA: hypothetical protein ENL03_06885, partial [Phycisphaerae bacterium]|nr:hypothetical protein [Phycisphaerae bacterium]
MIELSGRMTLTLLHFLWQAAVIATAALMLIRMLRPGRPQVRYAILLSALAMMAACPIVTFSVVSVPPVNSQVEIASVPEPVDAMPSGVVELPHESAHIVIASGDTVARPAANVKHIAPKGTQGLQEQSPDETSIGQDQPVTVSVLGWVRPAGPYLSALYLAGVCLMLLLLLLALRGGRRLRGAAHLVEDVSILAALARQAKRVALAFTPALAYCEQVVTPTVIGVLRPMVLLPVSIATSLSPEQIEAILAHELAHVLRHDYLVNLVQRIIESVLFFHPAVWLISRQIRIEREHCCDDLAATGPATTRRYAESLVTLAGMAMKIKKERIMKSSPNVNAVNKPSRLRGRILRLLGVETRAHTRLRRSWPVAAMLIAMILGAAITVHSLQAESPTSKPAKADQEKIAKLVGQLDDDSAKVRATAQKKLIEIGGPAIVELEKFYYESKDPDTQARTRNLIDIIKTPEYAKVLGLTAPVSVDKILLANDGGTTWINLVDAKGKKFEFCFERPRGIFPGDTPGPRRIFITFFITPSRKGAKVVAVAEEAATLGLVRSWAYANITQVRQRALLAGGTPGAKGEEAETQLALLRMIRILSERALVQPGGARPKAGSVQADATEIEKLIEQLGDNSFKVRNAAQKELLEIGPAAIEQLEVAVAKTTDVEIKTRIEKILPIFKKEKLIANLLKKMKNMPKEMDTDTLLAMSKGLAYLVRQQNADGSWDGTPGLTTSMAGLALMSGGPLTDNSESLKKAVEYILKQASDDGSLSGGGDAVSGNSMIMHGTS